MITLNFAIDAYFKAKGTVHELFGYKSDWTEIPMEDHRAEHWMLIPTGAGAYCAWSKDPFTTESIEAGQEVYGGPIYTDRHKSKWVYRTPTHVMISVDTQTDGNKFLMIFDAAKECTDNKLRQLYGDRWV